MTDKPEAARPTPARVGAGRPIPVREGTPTPAEPADPPAPSRTFRSADGSHWEVEVAGRARTGGRSEPGATLLLLVFRPAATRDGAVEALVPAESLAGLDELALEALRARARPFRADPQTGEFFSATRRRSRRE